MLVCSQPNIPAAGSALLKLLLKLLFETAVPCFGRLYNIVPVRLRNLIRVIHVHVDFYCAAPSAWTQP